MVIIVNLRGSVLLENMGSKGESNVFERNWREEVEMMGKDSSLHTFLLTVEMQIFCGIYEVLYPKFLPVKKLFHPPLSSFISHFMSYVFQYIPNSYPNPWRVERIVV